jgi:hypothetical protein
MSELVTLQYPTESGLTTLKLRRPKVRDMLASDKTKGSDAEKEISLFSNLCEVEASEIEALDMKDYSTLQKAYQAFLS